MKYITPAMKRDEMTLQRATRRDEDSYDDSAGAEVAGDVGRDSATGLQGMFAALYERDFLLFYLGAMSSNIGMWMRTVAQGWLVVTLTNSAFQLGLVNFFSFIPTLLFSPLGGVLADRYNNRKILMASQIGSTVATAVLATLIVTGKVLIWEVMLIAFLNGFFQSLSMPSFQVIVPELVGRKNLLNAIALNSARFNLTRAIGPTIGGVVIKFINIAGAYYCNALTYFIFFVTLLFVRPKYAARKMSSKREGALASLISASGYIWRHDTIRPVMLIAGVQTFFIAPYTALMPAFAKNILHMGASGYGLLLAAVGLGAFVSALVLAYQGNVWQRGKMMAAAQVVFAAGIVVFAVSTSVIISVAALLFVGWALVAFLTTGNTMLQTIVPTELRGRVMSFWMLITFGLVPLGSLLAGAIAEAAGPVWTLVAGAAITLLVSGVIVLRDHDFLDPRNTRNLEELADEV